MDADERKMIPQTEFVKREHPGYCCECLPDRKCPKEALAVWGQRGDLSLALCESCYALHPPTGPPALPTHDPPVQHLAGGTWREPREGDHGWAYPSPSGEVYVYMRAGPPSAQEYGGRRWILELVPEPHEAEKPYPRYFTDKGSSQRIYLRVDTPNCIRKILDDGKEYSCADPGSLETVLADRACSEITHAEAMALRGEAGLDVVYKAEVEEEPRCIHHGGRNLGPPCVDCDAEADAEGDEEYPQWGIWLGSVPIIIRWSGPGAYEAFSRKQKMVCPGKREWFSLDGELRRLCTEPECRAYAAEHSIDWRWGEPAKPKSEIRPPPDGPWQKTHESIGKWRPARDREPYVSVGSWNRGEVLLGPTLLERHILVPKQSALPADDITACQIVDIGRSKWSANTETPDGKDTDMEPRVKNARVLAAAETASGWLGKALTWSLLTIFKGGLGAGKYALLPIAKTLGKGLLIGIGSTAVLITAACWLYAPLRPVVVAGLGDAATAGWTGILSAVAPVGELLRRQWQFCVGLGIPATMIVCLLIAGHKARSG